jgi:hypothetical protein
MPLPPYRACRALASPISPRSLLIAAFAGPIPVRPSARPDRSSGQHGGTGGAEIELALRSPYRLIPCFRFHRG